MSRKQSDPMTQIEEIAFVGEINDAIQKLDFLKAFQIITEKRGAKNNADRDAAIQKCINYQVFRSKSMGVERGLMDAIHDASESVLNADQQQNLSKLLTLCSEINGAVGQSVSIKPEFSSGANSADRKADEKVEKRTGFFSELLSRKPSSQKPEDALTKINKELQPHFAEINRLREDLNSVGNAVDIADKTKIQALIDLEKEQISKIAISHIKALRKQISATKEDSSKLNSNHIRFDKSGNETSLLDIALICAKSNPDFLNEILLKANIKKKDKITDTENSLQDTLLRSQILFTQLYCTPDAAMMGLKSLSDVIGDQNLLITNISHYDTLNNGPRLVDSETEKRIKLINELIFPLVQATSIKSKTSQHGLKNISRDEVLDGFRSVLIRINSLPLNEKKKLLEQQIVSESLAVNDLTVKAIFGTDDPINELYFNKALGGDTFSKMKEIFLDLTKDNNLKQEPVLAVKLEEVLPPRPPKPISLLTQESGSTSYSELATKVENSADAVIKNFLKKLTDLHVNVIVFDFDQTLTKNHTVSELRCAFPGAAKQHGNFTKDHFSDLSFLKNLLKGCKERGIECNILSRQFASNIKYFLEQGDIKYGDSVGDEGGIKTIIGGEYLAQRGESGDILHTAQNGMFLLEKNEALLNMFSQQVSEGKNIVMFYMDDSKSEMNSMTRDKIPEGVSIVINEGIINACSKMKNSNKSGLTEAILNDVTNAIKSEIVIGEARNLRELKKNWGDELLSNVAPRPSESPTETVTVKQLTIGIEGEKSGGALMN